VRHCPPPRASFLEQTLAGGGFEVEWCVSSTVNDCGYRQRGAMESRRRKHAKVRAQDGAPSSAMRALLVGPMRGFALVDHSGDGLVGNGGGDFWRMRTRCYLWIMLGSRCS
jgi:hypothetical protein